ncbi:hypothetical protein FOZ76_17595 [Verticiella sediminum]|uniref:DUF342 domain-containing protein n=1 Tax=Verticiella sediminum TaxID=1247510 RepID=A0A556AGN0_9BURK|nr:hypothetical protein [Verticiella sediminum]TSH92047.1 hypothetical protein FOZ76_17595 [Verticiella sediminum]
MDITKAFIKAKQPCTDGFRWYVRNARQDSTYQELLDALVQAGRVQDACWLLEQFGPTDAVLALDTLEAGDFVFAGTLQVRRGIDVDGVLMTGRGIRAGGGVRVGENLGAGGDVVCDGALICGGALKAEGRLQAAWSIQVGGELDCEDLRVGWDLECEKSATVRGHARIGQVVRAGGGLHCAKNLQAGGGIECVGDLSAGQGIEAGDLLQGGGHVRAGWGIKVRGDLLAAGAIRAGESLCAEGEIRAGEGYGVYAGLDVRVQVWEDSARVHASRLPEALRSGCWAGPLY